VGSRSHLLFNRKVVDGGIVGGAGGGEVLVCGWYDSSICSALWSEQSPSSSVHVYLYRWIK
jgi:hypothetical protein